MRETDSHFYEEEEKDFLRKVLNPEVFTLSQSALEKLKKNFVSEKKRKEIEDTQALLVERQMEHSLEVQTRFLEGEKELLSESISNDSRLDEGYTLNRGSFTYRWQEDVSRNSPEAEAFIRDVRDLVDGFFCEVLQLSLLKEGKVVWKDATMGTAQEVTEEDIQELIRRAGSEQEEFDEVCIVHNHPDPFAPYTVLPKEDFRGKENIVHFGGLSQRDILSVDDWKEEYFPEVPVFMVAVNDNGLTYCYEAGTHFTENRTWRGF